MNVYAHWFINDGVERDLGVKLEEWKHRFEKKKKKDEKEKKKKEKKKEKKVEFRVNWTQRQISQVRARDVRFQFLSRFSFRSFFIFLFVWSFVVLVFCPSIYLFFSSSSSWLID